jgi:hypothetical protein
LAESCIEPKNPLPERVLKRGDKKVTPSGLLLYAEFQLFMRFVDLKPKN